MNEQLLAITQAYPTVILTLWDWIAEAWRATYPTVDLTSLGGGLHWKDTAQVIKVTRKLAILAMICDKNVNTPMQVTASNAIKKAILKGAPPYLKMSDLNSIAQAGIIEDIIKVFRLAEDLHGIPKFTFDAQIRNLNRGFMPKRKTRKQENPRQTFNRS